MDYNNISKEEFLLDIKKLNCEPILNDLLEFTNEKKEDIFYKMNQLDELEEKNCEKMVTDINQLNVIKLPKYFFLHDAEIIDVWMTISA